MLGAATSCEELLGASRSCQELPGAPRSCEELPGTARSCEELPGAARSREELPGCQDAPKRAQTSHCLAREAGIGLIEQLNCTELNSFNKLTDMADLRKGLQELAVLQ